MRQDLMSYMSCIRIQFAITEETKDLTNLVFDEYTVYRARPTNSILRELGRGLERTPGPYKAYIREKHPFSVPIEREGRDRELLPKYDLAHLMVINQELNVTYDIPIVSSGNFFRRLWYGKRIVNGHIRGGGLVDPEYTNMYTKPGVVVQTGDNIFYEIQELKNPNNKFYRLIPKKREVKEKDLLPSADYSWNTAKNTHLKQSRAKIDNLLNKLRDTTIPLEEYLLIHKEISDESCKPNRSTIDMLDLSLMFTWERNPTF